MMIQLLDGIADSVNKRERFFSRVALVAMLVALVTVLTHYRLFFTLLCKWMGVE